LAPPFSHTIKRRCWIRETKNQLSPGIAYLRTAATEEAVEYLKDEKNFLVRRFTPQGNEWIFTQRRCQRAWRDHEADVSDPAVIRALEEHHLVDDERIVFRAGTLPEQFPTPLSARHTVFAAAAADPTTDDKAPSRSNKAVSGADPPAPKRARSAELAAGASSTTLARAAKPREKSPQPSSSAPAAKPPVLRAVSRAKPRTRASPARTTTSDATAALSESETTPAKSKATAAKPRLRAPRAPRAPRASAFAPVEAVESPIVRFEAIARRAQAARCSLPAHAPRTSNIQGILPPQPLSDHFRGSANGFESPLSEAGSLRAAVDDWVAEHS